MGIRFRTAQIWTCLQSFSKYEFWDPLDFWQKMWEWPFHSAVIQHVAFFGSQSLL